MKPDDIVGSSIKATQTAMDNLSVKADKFFKSLQDYGYMGKQSQVRWVVI